LGLPAYEIRTVDPILLYSDTSLDVFVRNINPSSPCAFVCYRQVTQTACTDYTIVAFGE